MFLQKQQQLRESLLVDNNIDQIDIFESPSNRLGEKVYEEDEINLQAKPEVLIKDEEEEMENNIEKEIDQIQKEIDWSFKEGELNFQNKLFPQFQFRNNIKVPFTYTLIEDAMYVDEGVVVSLEYYVFNNEQDHIHLTDINEVGITEENVLRLNTDKYQSTGAHPMSIFRNPPKNYVDAGKDYLQNPKLGKFMTAEEPEIKKSFKISGVLSFWKAEIYGTLEKMCEKSFTHECEFAYTTQGNMALQITNDKKLLTLTYISKYGDKNENGDGIISPDSQVKILAWAIDIKNYKFTQTLDKKFLNMNDSLSQYLQQKAQEIRLIRSIKVTASFRYVILTYNQQKLIPKNQEQSFLGAESSKKGQKFQIAIKYAIFEVKSGKLVFEYGGFNPQLKMHDKEKTIYNIGMAVQDVKMIRGYDELDQRCYNPTAKDENINFFCVGEFLDWTDIIKQNKRKQERQQRELSFTQLEEITEIEYTEFNWTLAVKYITLADIIQSGDTPEQRLQWVNSEIIMHCQQLATSRKDLDQYDCFQFKSSCILLQQNWQAGIIVNVNSHFDQIGVLNLPTSSNLQNRRLYFLYKTQKKNLTNFDETPQHTWNKNTRDSMPVVIKQLPKDGLILHGRNSQIKRDMYYTVQQRLQRTYAVCMRFKKYEQQELGNLQIQIHEEHAAYNQIDVWCFKESYMKGPPAINGHIDEEEDTPLIEHDGRPVMQLCSIDSQNLQIELMTKIPRKINLSRYDYYIKSSDSLYQQQGQWPFFAYCLGIEKICLLHFQRDKKSRQYYYKCQFGHKFLCFCEFNNYADAGFFAENLLIEGCVKFCFLTEYKNFIYLNILLIDPYHPKIQFCVFTSTYVVSKDDFKAKDSIEAAFIIPSKSSNEISGKDKDFQIYVMVQYNSILRRCKFKKTAEEIDDDSDFGIDQTDLFDNQLITKEDEINQTYLEHIFMQLDEKNFLYYVSKQGTQLKIMEINPKRNNFKHHLCIYEWKANKCSALSVEFNGKEFSFIDDTKVAFTLNRQVNSRQLQLVSESNFNEMYQQDFKHEEYDPVIMCQKYVIQGNKLFYLESEGPFPNGYLGMETITENFKSELPPEFNDEIKWFQGPVIFNGSNQFGAMDRFRKFYAYLNVMALPDSTTKTLMIDNNSQINMSTFLSNGEILLRCAHRYLVFDKEGYFKVQVYFDDQDVKAGEVRKTRKQSKGSKTLKKIVKRVQKKLKKDFIKQQSHDLGLQEESDTSDEFEFNEKIDQHNKMKLIQFSSDNKKFLFLNQLSRQLKVYKFVSRIVKEGKLSQEEYFFKKMYDLEYKYCEILKDSREFLFNEQKYEFKEYLEKFVNINVETDGSITLILISQPDRLLYPDGNFSSFELIVSFYKVESRNGVFKYRIFNIKKQLPMPPIEEIKECHSFESESIEDRINEIKLVQKRLLPELKDKTDLQIMEDDQEYVETRIRRKINSSFSHDILVIWQGSWLRWTRIVESVNDDQEKCYSIGELQKLEITFEKYSEIIRVMVIKLDQKVRSGYEADQIMCENELLQIILKIHSSDQSDNKFIILTWNLTYNYQIQIMEVSDLNNERLEFNLVKGLNQKLNYFFDSNQITDLEICIPNQINRNQQEQLRHRSYHQILTRLLRFHNQRKIFFDGSRYLQTKVPQALVFSYSYIQLRQWRDIFFQKNQIQMFQQVVKLEDCLIDFDGQNLFHVYVLNNDVLQYIHDEYMAKKAAENLTELEEILPLLIVMSDCQNYTPLFRAIEKQNQKGFELLIEMVTDTSNRFITKLVIRSLPKMLRIDSGAVLQFFENSVYKPLAYQSPIIMPWPDIFGDEPQFFTAKTTLLTQQTILQKFFSKKTEQKEEKKQEVVEEEQKGFETKENKLKKLKDARDFEFALERGNLEQKSLLREYFLKQDLQDESLSAQMQGKELDLESQSMGANRRVQVQVLDFDFLFQNSNCEVLIQTLSQLESNKILTQKSIKCFVELMWSKYQPVIFYNIFVYYLTYLFLSVYLCSQQLPYFWEEQKLKEAAIAEGKVHQTGILSYILVSINLFISLRILVFFVTFELIQLRDSSFYDYFTQTWNLVDVVQMLINSLLILYTTLFLITGQHLIPKKSLVRYAAYGNFLMWFKMFYWMRLFKATAKYVTLIVQTLTDLTCFMIMVGIIIQAFATFFYIINLNAMDEGLSYLADYGMPQYLTSVVQVYFYSIGEFSYDSFSTGANVKSTWIMFLLATFVNSILFMNMLIAIMGETFGVVTENEEANGLQQQVALIADYVSLVDANEVWGDTPYIIMVQAVEQTEESEVDTGGLLQTMQELVEKKIDRLTQTSLKKLSSIDEKLDQ